MLTSERWPERRRIFNVKLAIVTETFPPEINGVAMTFGVIARELGRRGHEVTVYRPQRNDLPSGGEPCEFDEVPMRGVPIPGYPMLQIGLPAGRALRARWAADRPDLVHVATEGPLGASAVTSARALKIPITSSFHTNFHAYAGHYGFGPLHRLVLRWLRYVHNRTSRTFAPTLELCRQLNELGFRNVRLLSRGVDTWQFHPAHRTHELRRRWHADDDDPVVIHAGRLAPEKNYGLLFRAFDAMRGANPRCRFVVVGDGPLRAKWQRVRQDVVFTGFIPRDELARHYASADIYIHSSLTETFGNVLTEAMASGLSVAGFDYAAARELVRHRQNGLVAPREQPEALVKSAVMLATHPLLRSQLRHAARQSVESHSWSRVIARFEADLFDAAGIVHEGAASANR